MTPQTRAFVTNRWANDEPWPESGDYECTDPQCYGRHMSCLLHISVTPPAPDSRFIIAAKQRLETFARGDH